MAVAQSVLSETQRETLEALGDTFIPAIEADSHDPVEKEFLARAASDMAVAAQIEGLMAEVLLPEEILLVGGLLDALAAEGFAKADLDARTQIFHAFCEQDADAKLGLLQLKALTLLFFYALPDEAGQNPNWEAIGYPGPNSRAARRLPMRRRRSTVEEVSGPSATLTADVCVIGSGAGGGVIAAECAKAGKSRARARDGRLPQRVGLQAAGAARLPRALLRRRARGHRVGIDRHPRRPDARRRDRHQLHELRPDARLGAEPSGPATGSRASTTRRSSASTWRWCSSESARTPRPRSRTEPTSALMAGCDALGYEHRPIWRNAALNDDPEFCGYCSMGCQQGCKRSAMKTWLQDCSDAGGRCVPRCHADRILAEDGRATGVEATVTHAGRLDHGSHGRGADGGGGLRLDRVAGAAAAQRHRRAGRRQEPAAPSGLRGDGHLRRARGGLARPGPVGAVGPLHRHRGRLRLPDRGHRACSPRCSAPATRGSRASSTSSSCRRSAGRRRSSRWRATTAPVRWCSTSTGGPVVRWDFDDEVDARLAVRAHLELAKLHQAAGRDRGVHRARARVPLAPGRGLRGVPRRARVGALRPARRGLLHRAPAGLVPDGLGPQDLGGRRPRRAARREGRLDRRRQRLPDAPRA